MSVYDIRCLPQFSILDSSVVHILQLCLLNDTRLSVSSSVLSCYGVCTSNYTAPSYFGLLHVSDTDPRLGICLMSTAGCTSYQVWRVPPRRSKAICADYARVSTCNDSSLVLSRVECPLVGCWSLAVSRLPFVQNSHIKTSADIDKQDGTRNKNKHSGWESGTA